MSLQAAIRPLKKNVADRKIILRALSGDTVANLEVHPIFPNPSSMKEK